VQTHADGSVLASYTYSYDPASRLTTETDNGATIGYGYDNANQLLSGGTFSYNYDPTGNRTGTGDVTGPDNQLLSDGTSSYTYDPQGNLLTKTTGTDVTTYSYDTENRLVGVVETEGGTLKTVATYTYDVFGNRIETQEYTATGGEVTTEYAYDGPNAWVNLDGSGMFETRQLFLPGQDQLLARISKSGTTVTPAWYLTDRQGSVRNLQSYDGSMALDTITYDAFGQVASESSPAHGDAYKYNGYVYDGPVGLYYVRARYYDAATGRWNAQDPIAFAGGDANLYRYVDNNPIGNVDPTGLAVLIKRIRVDNEGDMGGLSCGPLVGPVRFAYGFKVRVDVNVDSPDTITKASISQEIFQLIMIVRNDGTCVNKLSNGDHNRATVSNEVAELARKSWFDNTYTLKDDALIAENIFKPGQKYYKHELLHAWYIDAPGYDGTDAESELPATKYKSVRQYLVIKITAKGTDGKEIVASFWRRQTAESNGATWKLVDQDGPSPGLPHVWGQPE
jgi:RHS repeat-associated protein